MNTDTEYLKSIAEEIVASPGHNHSANNKANHHLVVEAGRLEKAIIHNLNSIENFTQRDTFHFNTLSRLVNICDILYDDAGGVSPDVTVLLDLMSAVRQVVPSEIRPNLKLPKAFVEIQKVSINEKWAHHSSLMEQYKVDGKLIEIAAIPFNRFTGPPQKLCWGDFTWFKGYLAKLDIMDWDNADCASKTEALISLLIGRDFNDDRFYIYCKKYVQKRTAAVSGKRNRLLEFVECEKLVLQDTQVGSVSFDHRANTVSTRLIKWIKEEIDFVETYEREPTFAKLRFNMYANRVAFFFKLLSEHKVFGDTTFKELSHQVASTCLSSDGEEILAATVISKAYPKDRKMLEEMETLLLNMLTYVRTFLPKK